MAFSGYDEPWNLDGIDIGRLRLWLSIAFTSSYVIDRYCDRGIAIRGLQAMLNRIDGKMGSMRVGVLVLEGMVMRWWFGVRGAVVVWKRPRSKSAAFEGVALFGRVFFLLLFIYSELLL